MASRFNGRALLLLAGVIVLVQYLRPGLLRAWPGLGLPLGAAPNFLAALGLPFTWRERRTWEDHRRHCLVTLIALTVYELVQLAGYVLARRWFDPWDIASSMAGAMLAAGIGWIRLGRREAPQPPAA